MKDSHSKNRAFLKMAPLDREPGLFEGMQAVLKATGEVFYQCGPGGRPMRFYGACPQWLGVKGGVLDGGRAEWLRRVCPEDVAEAAAMDAAPAASKPQSLEYRLNVPGGKSLWLRETQALVRDSATGKLVLAGMLAEVSEKREMAARLRYYQKMRVFGELAGGVGHDFNNILALFQGYTELLQMEGDDAASREEYLGEMTLAVERARELTMQLNRFSRFRAECPAVTDLVGLLRDCRRVLRRLTEERIELVLSEKAEAAWIKADPLDLETLLLNLAVNAREAMPRGGRLELEAGRTQSAKNPRCYLAVRDTGEGIGEGTAKRIFERGFTTRKRASAEGLGLTVCREIAMRFGGRLSFKSSPGKGTEFRASFPAIKLPGPEALPAKEKLPLGHGEEILLVEDDAPVRKTLSRMIMRLGYKVRGVANGEAAVRLLGKETKIRLVISDLVMPLMGGRELAEIIQSRWSGMPMILISGYALALPDQPHHPYHRFFMPKPVALKSLAWHIRQLIDV